MTILMHEMTINIKADIESLAIISAYAFFKVIHYFYNILLPYITSRES